ncbi:MAG: DUF4407 domain-containing protein [Leadbetterella sp.]|nr:DUF4407 domain-containing protein [Leadbetterella sp.]
MKIPFWKRPFLFLSGTDYKTISECPTDNATRYALLGVLVCIPAILGFCSASFSVSLIFTNYTYSIFIAIIWAFTILTIDRCIAAYNPEIYDSNTEKLTELKSKKAKENSIYISRVVLSIVLGIVIAEPLCVKIFQDEITEELNKETLEQVAASSKQIDTLINIEKEVINNHYKEWQKKEMEAQDEAKGKNGPRGTKKVYWSIKNAANRLDSIYQKSELSGNKIIDSLNTKKSNLEVEIKTNKAKGLSGQINALNKVAQVNPALNYSIWIMRLFFIFLELIPLILKSSLKKRTDAYVVMCHQNNNIAIAYNGEEENNSTKKRMIAASTEENKVLEQILMTKNIERAAKDFKFFFAINEQSGKSYEQTKSNIEKIIRDDTLRLQVLNNLITAYQDFLAKTITAYTSKDSMNEED